MCINAILEITRKVSVDEYNYALHLSMIVSVDEYNLRNHIEGPHHLIVFMVQDRTTYIGGNTPLVVFQSLLKNPFWPLSCFPHPP